MKKILVAILITILAVSVVGVGLIMTKIVTLPEGFLEFKTVPSQVDNAVQNNEQTVPKEVLPQETVDTTLKDNGPAIIQQRLQEYQKQSGQSEPIHIIQNLSTEEGVQPVDDVQNYETGTGRSTKKTAVVNQAPINVQSGIEFSGGFMLNSDMALKGVLFSSDGKVGDWHFGDGTTAMGSSVKHSYGQAGIYDVTFLAEVSGSVYVTQTKIVVGGVKPSFDIKNPTPKVNDVISINGSASRSVVGSITAYQWACDQSQASQCIFSNPTGSQGTLQFTQPGVYQVSLTATNNIGARETVTKTFSVSGEKPVAKITSITPTLREHHPAEYEFNAEESVNMLGQKRDLSYEWDFDGDGNWDEKTTSPVIVHEYAQPGEKTVKLRVQHSLDRKDYLSEPVSQMLSNVSTLWGEFEMPFVLATGESFAFLSQGSSDVTYAWKIEPADGVVLRELEEASRLEGVFSKPGTYTVTLTLEKEGDSVSIIKTIPVRQKNMPLAIVQYSQDRGLSWQMLPDTFSLARNERGVTDILLRAHSADENGMVGCDSASLNYSWSVNGVPVSSNCDPSVAINARLNEAKTYNLQLMVYHPGNQNISHTASFDISVENLPPQFVQPVSYETNQGGDDFGPGPVSFLVTASAQDTDTDSPIVQYFFEPMENGSPLSDTQLLTTGQAYFDLSQYNGVHTFSFRVTAIDRDGGRTLSQGEGTYTFRNEIQNARPEIIDYTANKSGVAKGESVRFDIIAQDPQNEELSYKWFVSQNGSVFLMEKTNAPYFEYVFSEAGVYGVRAEVTDGTNTVSSDDTITISVRE